VSAALAATHRLARVAELLAASPSADARAHAADLRKWLSDPDKGTLDAALGLSLGRGENDPRDDLLRQKRDTLLIVIANKISADKDVSIQARILHSRLSTYYTGRWRFDRVKESNPYQPAALECFLCEIFRLKDHLPVVGSLRRILRATKSGF
jgi:hypothetical protein